MLWLAVFAAVSLLAAVLANARARERRHARRERGLEECVQQRTEELEREKRREKARAGVLEMLVSNQSLGRVLDAVAEITRTENPGGHCAILLRRPLGYDTAAAPGVPKPWLKALAAPHAVPFEVWNRPCSFQAPERDPAWRLFAAGLTGPGPERVRSVPVGIGSPLGAILVFDGPDGAEIKQNQLSLEASARLVQLAIEHSRLYDDLQFRAQHDVLTGLANRALFEERLEHAVRESRTLERKFAVLLIDIDHFKNINDTMSHRAGDLLLIEIADRMRRVVLPTDTVARIGGDEFSILIAEIKGSAEAEETAERVLKAIRQPMIINGRTLVATASVGLALFPNDGAEPEVLLREADAAMYCAKGLGRNQAQSFSTRNDKLDRVRMDQELRAALREGWFSVHYQPKIGFDGRFGGLEALARLKHPVLGQIPPMEFIPIAEESGLIVELGAWVLDEVCRQIADWKARGFGEVSVAVNASPVQITRPDYARQVRACLAKHDVPPRLLELELTEGMFIAGGEESQRQMRDLRAFGVHFSIDDFGTGYSSLSYLYKLEVDAIKLDRSFVQSIDTDQAARRLVQAMIAVAQGLGLNVVAEGVETEAQRAVLVSAGCPVMQGYFFSRPLDAKDIETYMHEFPSDTDDLLRLERALSASPYATAVLLDV